MWPARKCISRLPRTPKPLSLVFLNLLRFQLSLCSLPSQRRPSSSTLVVPCPQQGVRATARHINTKLSPWRDHHETQPQDSGNSPNTSSNNEDRRTSPRSSLKTQGGKKNTKPTQDISQELGASYSTLSSISNISVGLKQGIAEQKDGGIYTESQKVD